MSESFKVIFIPRNNNDDDAVVMMSIRKYNSLKEIEHLLGTEANRNHLIESMRQMGADEVVKLDLDVIWIR